MEEQCLQLSYIFALWLAPYKHATVARAHAGGRAHQGPLLPHRGDTPHIPHTFYFANRARADTQPSKGLQSSHAPHQHTHSAGAPALERTHARRTRTADRAHC